MKNSMLFHCFWLFIGIHCICAQSFNDVNIAANNAINRLNEAVGGQPAGNVQATSGGTMPAWVNDPSSAYPGNRYLAAVGFAADRAGAESRAFAAIVSFFGQSIQAEFTVAETYSEAVQNGIITVSENTNVQDIIITASSMDKLIGAEIGRVWDDRRGTVYALAFIELKKTIDIYTDLIIINQINIDKLTSMTNAEKNTFYGYARYKLAALLARMNEGYSSIVSLAGGQTVSLNLKSKDEYNIEALNILKNISVGFSVTGDHNNRVRDAFAKVLSGEGLRTQSSAPLTANTPYILEVSVNMNEVTFPNNNFIFCRYTVSANLKERETGAVLFPFTINDRSGHATYEAAQARAFMDIEKNIEEKYPVLFREYLAALLPE